MSRWEIFAAWALGTFCAALLGVFLALVFHEVYVVWTEGPVNGGIVVEKRHRAPWVQMVTSGKSTIPIYHPESWTIVVYGFHEKSHRGDTTSFGLQRSDWEIIPIGIKYP